MLVEDDNSLREIYQARLMAEGYETVTAKDGEEALALVGQEKPDLIILDVMMPKISGFDTLDILRSTPATKYTKVIIMSALSQAEDKARAEKLGANKYLVKSQVTLEDIVKTVKEILESDEENSNGAPKDLDINSPDLSKPTATETPPTDTTSPPAEDTGDKPTTNNVESTGTDSPDIAKAQAAVDEQAESTSEAQEKINNEESNDMNQDTPTNEPAVPSETPATSTDASTPVTPAAEATSEPVVTSTDPSSDQVSSDPNPLSTTPSVDEPGASSEPSTPDVSTPPAGDTGSSTPEATTPDPAPTTTPPDPQLIGGSKVVEPSTETSANNSRLQELLAAEDSSNSGTPTTPPTPPAPAA